VKISGAAVSSVEGIMIVKTSKKLIIIYAPFSIGDRAPT
jgi:hypothetical protein